MARRISRNGTELLAQLAAAKAKITALGITWTTPPTLAAVTAAHSALQTSLADVAAKENAWRISAGVNRANIEAGADVMEQVDRSATALVGRDSPLLLEYGVEPWGANLPPLAQLVKIITEDGPITGSIRFDWENIPGATYEVRWYTDSACTQLVGSAVSTQSEYIISGLTPKTQYWMTATPHRGGQVGPVSDPATRVAPV